MSAGERWKAWLEAGLPRLADASQWREHFALQDPAQTMPLLLELGLAARDPAAADADSEATRRWLGQVLTPLARDPSMRGRSVWWMQHSTLDNVHALVATTSDQRLQLALHSDVPGANEFAGFFAALLAQGPGPALVACNATLSPACFAAADTLPSALRERLQLISPLRSDLPVPAPAAPAAIPAAAAPTPPAANAPLYRPEAMQSQQRRLEGDVLLVQPLSHRVLTAGAMGLLAALVLFACFGRYARTTQAAGVLMPEQGVLKVAATQGGLVSGLKVKVGDQVEAGQPLFSVSNPRVAAGGGEVDRQVLAELERIAATLESERGNAQTQAALEQGRLQSMLETSQQQAARMESERTLEAQRLRLLDSTRQRYQQLAGKGLVAPLQAQELEEQWLSARGRLLALEREQDTARARVAEARTSLAEQPLKLKSRMAELDQRSAEVRRQIHEAGLRVGTEVSAPRAGRVAAVLVAEGARIAAEKPVILLMDADAELEAQLFVPTRGIAMLEPGQEVRLKLAAFPYQRYGYQKGRVVDISATAVDPGSMDVPLRLNESAYTVKVALVRQTIQAFGEQRPLTAGMQVDADIITEQPRIIEWALEPLLSLRGNS